MSAATIRELIAHVASRIGGSPLLVAEDEVQGASRDARDIVASLLNVAPVVVSQRNDERVDSDLVTRALAMADRRATGEPLAYVLGAAAFRMLNLFVDSRVLIPRPETEIVVEHALRVSGARLGGTAVDIGTGSGAIALSLATEGRFDRVIATDLSAAALEVAQLNARRVLRASVEGPSTGKSVIDVGTTVEFRQGADFEPLGGIKANLVVSNPPYIAPSERSQLPASVRDWEPAMALFADQDGMARYDVLLAEAPLHLVPGGWLVLEVDSGRAAETARRATQSGLYEWVELKRDLTNRDRVLLARVSGDIIRE